MREDFISRRTTLKSIGAIGAAGIGLTSAASSAAADRSEGLESFYKLDGTTAKDYTGNGNHGTVDGALSGAARRANACFSFDGIGDTIDIPHVLSGHSAGSYSVWVNAHSLDEDKAVLGD